MGCHPGDMPSKPSSSLSCPDPAASPSRRTCRLSLAGAHAARPGTHLSSAEVSAFIRNTEPFESVVVVVSSVRWGWDIGRVVWGSCRSPWGTNRSTANVFIFPWFHKVLGWWLQTPALLPTFLLAPFLEKRCLRELHSLEVWGWASPHTWPQSSGHTARALPSTVPDIMARTGGTRCRHPNCRLARVLLRCCRFPQERDPGSDHLQGNVVRHESFSSPCLWFSPRTHALRNASTNQQTGK